MGSALLLTVALLARPVAHTCGQLVLVSSVVVTTSFVYHLALPVALVGVLAWLVRHRRRQHAEAGLVVVDARDRLGRPTP